AALQNGGSPRADLLTLKAGYFKSPVHVGVSGQYNPGGTNPNGDTVRRLRGAAFGGVKYGEWVYVSELVVGQDRPDVGPLADTTTTLIAYTGDLSRRLSRALLVRVKYDFLNPNTKFKKGFSPAQQADPDLFAARRAQLAARAGEFKSERFGIEADYQPYPFMELKAAYRYLHYESPDIQNVHQGLAMAHFSF